MEALRSAWGFGADQLVFQPVGFGSFHWLARSGQGDERFVTVDDLHERRRHPAETTQVSFERLRGAFEAAYALGTTAGLDFVVGPLPDRQGSVLWRLDDRYSLVVHPLIVGSQAGENGQFHSATERAEIAERLVELHRCSDVASAAPREDGILPNRDRLLSALDRLGQAWDTGPYGEAARRLLEVHGAEIEILLRTYDRWADEVLSDPDRWVITHGEPGAANVLVTAGGPVLVDWESALIAPPERDLWDLAEGDPSVLGRYRASGARVQSRALSFYRLYYDLFEIGGYIGLFGSHHGEDADTNESWKNLSYFLRPVERWPELVG